jgi:hypothetical protein
VKQVLERYPTQVKLVYKNFPIDTHPKARPAAEAAMCADEQGKFWDLHHKLFEKAPQIGADQLPAIATEAGVDAAKLDECVKAKKQAAKIDADIAEGKKSGVAGTPAFYVNGVPLAGGRSVDDFAKAINAELTRLGKPVPEPPKPVAQAPAPAAAPQPMVTPMPSPADAPAAPGQPAPGTVPPSANAPAPAAPAAPPSSPEAPKPPPH